MDRTHDPRVALAQLSTLVHDVLDGVARLGLLHQDDAVADRFRALVALHAELRLRWPTAVEPPASSREELQARVLALDAPARVRELASTLERATLTAPDDRAQRRWERLRDAAVLALVEISAGATTAPPGPHDASAPWFPWAWSQRGSPIWAQIEDFCPDLFDFLDQISPSGWTAAPRQDEGVSAPEDTYDVPIEDDAIEADLGEEEASDEAVGAASASAAAHPSGVGKPLRRTVREDSGPVSTKEALSKLTDDQLASLFVADRDQAHANADRVLGPCHNRRDRRHRERFVQSEARAEFDRRRRVRPAPSPPGTPVGLSSVLTRLPPPANGLGEADTSPAPPPSPAVAAPPSTEPDPSEPDPREPDPPQTTVARPPPPRDPRVEVLRYAAFRDRFWTGLGRCSEAPWNRPGFAEDLARAADQAALGGDVARLHVFVRAQERRGELPLMFPDDLASVQRILCAPNPAVVGRSDERRDRLERASKAGLLGPELRWQVAVLLECLRPADAALGQPPPAAIVDAVDLESVWSAFADQLTTATQRGIDLLDVWRRQRSEASAADEDDVDELRSVLHGLYRELYSGAGGKIETTHCRNAWSQFVETARPTLEPLFPGEGAFDLDDVAERVRRLPKIHKRIADRGQAKLRDRRDMDKAADALTDAAQAVIEAMRREARRRAQRSSWLPDPAVVDALLDRKDDELHVVQRVVRRVVDLEAPAAGALPLDLLAAHPELIELLEPDTVSESGTSATPGDLSDPVLAAALLLRPVDGPSPTASLGGVLSSRGLPHLLPRLRGPLDEPRRAAVQRARSEAVELAYQLQGTLQELYTGLEHVGSLHAAELHAVIVESDTLVEQDAVPDERMLLGWLEHAVETARAALREEWRAQLDQAPPERRSELEPLVAAEGWVEASRHLGERSLARPISSRVTQFRQDASAAVPEPIAWLRGREGHEDLVRRWLEGSPDKNKLRALRSRFAAVVGVDEPTDRAAEEITIDMLKLRQRIDQQGMNPSFLPQLAQFRQLRIETVDGSTTPDKSAFPNVALQKLAKLEADSVLRIALTPRLTAANRQQLLSMLHQRSATAVLVDDLDLCRLLVAKQEEHLMVLGLLEIALEQLPIEKVVPFDTAEGQHIPPEMFVGRVQEARDLATAKTYTRVFSGRKLGKSALLRAVQHRFADKPLPDGRSLKVIYVNLVGAYEERDVVDEIVASVGHQLHHGVGDQPADAPRQRLQRLVTELTGRRPAEFFFFVCDESDQFVEHEVRTFQERRREDTLGWAMRGLEKHAVRFVFAGYRSTHRNEGVWENWGAPLMLKPLERAEAEDLVVGPLARIGVDASGHGASIAHRCGYQPAILLRFGRALVDEIRKDNTGFGRDGAKVAASQVSRAFAHTTVQDEIRTVVMANFHGNPLAQVVFCAALLELADLPAGAVLQDASDRIVRRVGGLAGEQSWTPEERSPQAFVEETLRELADRQLLAARGRGAFQLRIPHHLAVLLDEDPERVIRDHLRAIAAGTVDYPHSWRGLLEPGALDRVRETLEHGATVGLSAVVAGSSWEAALSDRSGLLRALDLREDDPRIRSGCTPAQAEACLRPGEPTVLFGGPELVRWALGRDADPSFEHLIEVVELRRLPLQGLGWWLQRARGIEFTDRDAVRALWRATRGVPDLVGSLDRRIVAQQEDTLGKADVEAALRDVEAALEGGGPASLDAGDRALLRLVIDVADQLFDRDVPPQVYARDLGDALTDSEILGSLGLSAVQIGCLKDAPRLRYLLAIGWLPSVPGGGDPYYAIGPIDADDPSRRLLRS